MKQISRRTFFRVGGTAVVVPFLIKSLSGCGKYPDDELNIAADNAVDNLKNLAENNSLDMDASYWALIALPGIASGWYNIEGKPLIDIVGEKIQNQELNSATELERAILAVCASGENPRDFYGANLVGMLKKFYDGIQMGDINLVNDDIWGLIALRTVHDSIHSGLIQNLVSRVRTTQNYDGGWSHYINEVSDADDTAAALIALTMSGEPKDSRTMQGGIGYLRNIQNPDGGFPFVRGAVSNSASDAWVINAMMALGQDPKSFYLKNNLSPVEHLLSLQNQNGAFLWTEHEEGHPIVTAYAVDALK